MINIAKIDTIENLKAEIAKIEDEPVKTLVYARLAKLDGKPNVNGAAIHVKEAEINNWQQVEIQISGRWIEPKETKPQE